MTIDPSAGCPHASGANLPQPERKEFATENPFSGHDSGYGLVINTDEGKRIIVADDETSYGNFVSAQGFHNYTEGIARKQRPLKDGETKSPCTFGDAAYASGRIALSFMRGDMTDADLQEGLMHDVIESQAGLTLPHPRLSELSEDTNGFLGYRALVVGFEGPRVNDWEHGTEQLLRLIKGLHELNKQHYPWVEGYSNDIRSSRFGLSLGETAYFMTYFHPHASVPQRRSDIPFIVFNSHDLMSELRRIRGDEWVDGQRDKIRQNQVDQGLEVPDVLGNFGDVPQFPQYTIPTTPAQRRFLDERSSDIFGGYILD